MKTSPGKKAEPVSKKHPEIAAAYNISKERRECRKQGKQTKEGVAWIEHGQLKAVPFSHFQNQNSPPSKAAEMFERWLDDVGLKPSSKSRSKKPRLLPAPSAKYRRCVLVSSGSSWHVWKYQEVLKDFAEKEKKKRKADRLAYAIPAEFIIDSPDLAPNVWHISQEKTVTERCLDFARVLLWEAAQLYESGCVYLDDFEEVYALWKGSPPMELSTTPRLALEASIPLKRSVDKIKQMLYVFTTFGMRKRVPDAAVALNEGSLVGSWLAEARAILTNAESLRMASNQGTQARTTTEFWDQLVKAPENQGKRAKELWEGLRNMTDPDYPAKKLSIDKENRLIRGDGSQIKFESFSAQLSRARKRHAGKN
jgi:hypothetical protein